MAYSRIKSIDDAILKKVSELMRHKIHDPNMMGVTLLSVKTSKDLSVARIYFSKIGVSSVEDQKKLEDSCNKISGFLKSALAKTLNLRKTPDLRFYFDSSIIDDVAIDALLVACQEQSS